MIEVAEARALAKAHDLQAVVVVSVERDGTVRVSTYGEDKRKCMAIGDWGQGLWSHAITAVPFQTVFGHGTGGLPTPLTPAEFQSLKPAQQAWARKYDAEPRDPAAGAGS